MGKFGKEAILDSQKVLETLRENLEIFEQFQIKSLALFGSTACDRATPNSDLDFIVEFQGSVTFDGYMGLKFCLEDIFNKKVDLVIETDLKPQIKDNAIAEAIYVSKSQPLS